MDQLTRSQPGSIDYAHKIATCSPGFLDLPTAPNKTGYFKTSNSRQSCRNKVAKRGQQKIEYYNKKIMSIEKIGETNKRLKGGLKQSVR